MALSASLKHAGHKTFLHIHRGNNKKLMQVIRKVKPHIIAFPVLTAYRQFMLNTTQYLKGQGVKSILIAGGHDCSFSPELITHPYLDILCVGEGEDAVVELADAVKKKKDYTKIKNLIVKKDGKVYRNPIRPFKEPDDRVLNDRDIYRQYHNYFKIIEFAQVMVGRGCPYSCSYCFNHKYRQLYAPVDKQYCKLRSPEKVIEELLMLKHKYKYRNIFFNDSTLAYNLPWLKKFLKLYKRKINLPFSINLVVSEVNEELCRLLAWTRKCYIVRFGLETGNEKLRMTVLNKRLTNRMFYDATRLLKKYRIRYSMAVMIGLPGETLRNSFETLEMARKIADKNSVIAVNVFKPFPKLDITEYGLKIGQYDPELIGDSNKIGNAKLNCYECFRTDKVAQKILNLSRFAQFYMHVPFLRPLIKKLIQYPDNFVYRFIWKFSESFFTGKAHTNSSFKFAIKYVLFYFGKPVRY
ncbi:B12-binding domain-containing radical SAM protein [Candidatus Woesearchaeota archaeon]|nr:B12-binding domain-containing radical SAM protein [Candidatus Woesearchaeota archaeon]